MFNENMNQRIHLDGRTSRVLFTNVCLVLKAFALFLTFVERISGLVDFVLTLLPTVITVVLSYLNVYFLSFAVSRL